jgi:hypothetical protein
MNCSSSGSFKVKTPSSEVFAYESPIWLSKVGDTVENISPKVEIVPLMNDLVILVQCELGTTIDRSGRVFVEHHYHLPIEKYLPRIHSYRFDLHVQLLASPGESRTHGFKLLNAFNSLDAILEYDVWVIIRVYM